MKVSVIVPVYNMEKYLSECLDSILNQTLDKVEVLCIDDSSTDSSLAILDRYSRLNSKVIIFHQKNQGAGAARNSGIKNARGKYVFFMDSDDYFPSGDVLEKLYSAAEEHQAFLCGGNIIDTRQRTVAKKFAGDGWRNFFECYDVSYHQRYLYQRQFLIQNDIMYPDYRRYQDPPFLAKAMTMAEHFYAMEKVVYMYRAGYKSPCFSQDVIVDILHGKRDVIKYVLDKRLDYQFADTIIWSGNPAEFYDYANEGNKPVWNAINEINEIVRQYWKGCTDIVAPSDITSFLEDCQTISREISQKKVIVYGAGQYGAEAIDFLEDRKADICGVAVTNPNENPDSFRGYPIRSIEEYARQREEIMLLIAASRKFQKEIVRHAAESGFSDIQIFDIDRIAYIKKRGTECHDIRKND